VRSGAAAKSGSPATRRAGAGGAERSTRAAAERRRAERRLRRAVTRLDGCLDELPTIQRRVLVLRAGLGAGPPRSGPGVARALDLRVERVRWLERRGLRHVRALAHRDACGSAAGGAAVATAGPGAPVFPRFRSAPEASAGPPTPATGGGEAGAGPDRAGGGRESGGVRGESAELPPPPGPGPGDLVTRTSLWVALGLMLLAGLAGFASPALSDRLRGLDRASRAS